MLTTEITTNTADFQRRGNGIFCHYQLFNHSMYNKEGSVKRVTLPPKIISPPQERPRFPLAKKTGLKTDLQTRWPQNMDFCTT